MEVVMMTSSSIPFHADLFRFSAVIRLNIETAK